MIRGSIRSRQGDIFSPRITLFRNSLSLLHYFPEAELEIQVSHCGIKQEIENVAIPDARKIWLLLRAASTSWVTV